MFKITFLISLTLISVFVVFPQGKTYLEEWGLKGKIRQINSYDIYYPADSENKTLPERKLTNIDILNRQGNLSVRYSFSGYGSGCYYTKTVYNYDQFNRKREIRVVETEKSDSFCVSDPHAFFQKPPAYFDVKVTLKERKTFTYNRQGKLLKESTFNKSDVLVQENEYQYNRLGMLTRSIIIQTENRISGATPGFIKEMDFQNKYENNGKKVTSYRYEDGKPIYREVHFYDSKRRIVSGELFRLEADDKNRIHREFLGSRTKSYFEGDLEIFDWTMCDKNGVAYSKLYILSKNDNEVMRLGYTLDPKRSAERLSHYRFDPTRSVEENSLLKKLLKYDHLVDKLDWIPTEQETRFYTFDKAGNIIRTTIVQQENPHESEKSKSEYEREIIYFQ